MTKIKLSSPRRSLRALLSATVLATVVTVPAYAESVLDGETIRILAIGDPVFQVMQGMHAELEEMAGGTIQLDVRPFDVLRQQVLLNARNSLSGYDLVAVDLPQFGEYRPYLTDLNPLIDASKYDGSDFHKVAWTGAQFGGQQLGIPIQPHPEILAYRKDLFDAAGLGAPVTTDDVLNAAKTLHGSQAGLSGICWNAARGTALGQTFIMDMGSFGQAPIDLPHDGTSFVMGDIQPENMHPMIASEAGHATANYLMELMKYSPPGVLNMAWDERVRVYGQGGCAMTYVWSGRSAIFEHDDASPAQGNTGYVPHPHGPGATTASTLGGWYLSIPNNIDESRIDLAWNVADWLTSVEMLAKYTEGGNCVSPRHSVSQDPEVISRCPVIPFVDAMAEAGQLQGWQRPPVPEIQGIVDVLGAEMHQMLVGDKTPDEAIENSQKLIDRLMKVADYY